MNATDYEKAEKADKAEPARVKTIGPDAALYVTNTHLRILLFVFAAIIGVMAWSLRDLAYQFAHVKVPVVEMTPVGLAQVVTSDTEFKPTPALLQWWLIHWCHDFYSRERATLATQYHDILWMATPKRREELLVQIDRTHWIDEFLRTPTKPEIRVDVTQMFLPRRMAVGPMHVYQAAMAFEESFVNGEAVTATRTLYAHVSFTIDPGLLIDKDGRVNSNMVLHNPVGFQLLDWYVTDNQIPPPE